MSDVSEISADRGDEFRTYPDREAAFAALTSGAGEPDAPPAFVVSDGRAWAVLRTPRTSPVDAAVLHDVLLPAWGVADEQIGYHHSLDQALHTTARQPGIVVAVHPPSWPRSWRPRPAASGCPASPRPSPPSRGWAS